MVKIEDFLEKTYLYQRINNSYISCHIFSLFKMKLIAKYCNLYVSKIKETQWKVKNFIS